tara:strand:- start:1488 stop:2180 length:693 start_codon:yes stop_codon:yes gene_type:complete
MTITKELVIIGDRSGSMRKIINETVDGINNCILKTKNDKDENEKINVSLKLFNNKEEMIWRHIPIEYVEEFQLSNYNPHGNTAILDALGNTLTYFMEKKLMNENCYDTVIIHVITDGKENSSYYFTSNKIKDLVKRAQEKYNIHVYYLAANQDAIFEAAKFGIDAARALNVGNDADSLNAAYATIARISSTKGTEYENVGYTQAERQASQSDIPIDAPALKRQNRLSYNQ